MSRQSSIHAGWVPYRLKLTIPEPAVDWCWLGRTRFTEAFFDNDIERAMRLPFNALFAHRTSFEALAAHCERSPGIPPAGFVFHMSRCGSTLVSRMLAAVPQYLVLSEASPVDWLARAEWIPEETRAVWFRWIISALAQERSGGETRCFIKFDTMSALALRFVRRVFPGAPWIFVHRNPEEVLVSHMRDPAPAMTPGVVTDIAPLGGTADMAPVEYAARQIGRICWFAADAMDKTGLAVDYADLPGAVTGSIARHFDLTLSDVEMMAMNTVAGFDAKHPKRRFEADGAGKRLAAAGEIRCAAEAWIWPGYREMLEKTNFLAR